MLNTQFTDKLYYIRTPTELRIYKNIPCKLRNNIIQLHLAYCKPQDYNLFLNYKNRFT